MTEYNHNELIFLKLIRDNKGILYKICHLYCRNSGDREDLMQEITERSEGYDRGGPWRSRSDEGIPVMAFGTKI